MRTRFMRFGDAAKEYFGGNEDALIEAVLLGPAPTLGYVRLAPAKVRLGPPGLWTFPDQEHLDRYEQIGIHGFFPLPSLVASAALTRGASSTRWVVYRDFSIEGSEGVDFYDVPRSPTFDRMAALREAREIARADVWFSRKQLERAVEQHFEGAQEGRTGRWPWGDHETVLLRHLAAAAERFWKNYEPAEPDTAPTNKDVATWLIERGVSGRTAEYMATILRADGLPTGPRK